MPMTLAYKRNRFGNYYQCDALTQQGTQCQMYVLYRDVLPDGRFIFTCDRHHRMIVEGHTAVTPHPDALCLTNPGAPRGSGGCHWPGQPHNKPTPTPDAA